LNNPREAAAELGRISPRWREHPAVLEVQWRLYAAERLWEEACELGRRMVLLAPDEPAGWIDRSYALHELKRTREAWELLLPAAEKFPNVGLVPYNLACYACQMDDRAEAQRWLQRAATIIAEDELKQLALKDKDLEPLWPEISQW
jgi:Flp pilus assembly protein TadD